MGFMGAGKSTVGRRLADALGWRFVDLDVRVEEALRRTVPEIFRVDGEDRFREVEAHEAGRVLEESGVVVAAGGGWAAKPGRLQRLPEGTVSVWLKVSPAEAVRRVGRSGVARPLLEVADPLEEAGRLLASREEAYRRAALQVDTDGLSPEDVTARIMHLVAGAGGTRPENSKSPNP